ncbi:TatD family hydrolase [Geotalea uraniireducens]|uniref:Hydrolase, TatD family n=1 Tax=Geotalea uraniireducens (strain Rf4) TaxID=351605 RepID=A5G9T8_GEOUR|nr:TatD family hydrolase [Geotalea uraniireducens]ABQ28556.1 hydrolase, TatD family [Geotalea uraniireducens Rf4]
MLIDTHCHLAAPSLASRLPEVIDAGKMAGVEKFIVPGVGPEDWELINELQMNWQEIYPAFGLHPMRADLICSEVLVRLEFLSRSAVAIGEIGLDYTLTDVPRQIQISAFRSQLALALKYNLPILIHCRKAFQDLLTILKDVDIRKVGGVMHAFSGSPETAQECIKLGLYISVAGTVTYSNAVRPLEVVKRIPLQRLLLETDAPDLTPEPYRGQANEPAFIVETARKVAQIKGVTVEEVATATTLNANKLFRLI